MGGQANTGSLFGFTNVKGSLQGVVSPNTTAGFSVVTYNLNTSSVVTVGHGLSKAPELIINKGRDSSSTWWAFTTVIDGSMDYIEFSGTSAKADDSLMSLPTSTVFSQVQNYTLQQNVVSYCFHSVEGYSKISTYTGNGSTDGTFVYTGFKPKWLLQRRTNASGQGWTIQNSDNQSYNEINNYLFAQSNGSTFSGYAQIDFLSNGFKIRTADAQTNGSGDTYIYMAFAENPFVTSTGKPVTAR
jgi:hypothetical protein